MLKAFIFSFIFLSTLGWTPLLKSAEPPSDPTSFFYIVKAPTTMQQLWKSTPELFKTHKQVKPHNSSRLAKWHQLSKFWSKNKNEFGHYERKESIVISSDENHPIEIINQCYQQMKEYCSKFLKNLETTHHLPNHSLTMDHTDYPSHVLRLLHYLDHSTVIAHYDTSIMTCLYYQDQGLQLKINGKWIDAPDLQSDEMLVMYGIPGEILSNGRLKAIKHRVHCNKRYVLAYFYNTPKDYALSSEMYSPTTMAHVYQEAQLWYANVNARVIRKYCQSTVLPWYLVLYGWLAQIWTPVNENHLSKKISNE